MSTELAKNFPHNEAEARWYQAWLAAGCFHSEPDGRAPYTIVMPPPNVTGILHMGHALNNTVQDVLIRRAKAQGFNTCWVPGTDHASIATEAKVVAMLRERGIDKKTLSRDEFLKYAWEWKEKYGGIILQQLKKLGCALDWDRTHFTMDGDYYKAVIRVFVELYNKGYIYRGVKMVNWDPQGKTALSDEEVIFKQTQSKLYYVAYEIRNADGFPISGPNGIETGGPARIIAATVRPETILGDTAICVHPDDERYQHLKGMFCIVPLTDRRIPIIFDEYIDPEFGTGALKVTPAHDINDYNLGIKHKLAVIDTLNEDGTMSEAAAPYTGMDRFAVRKQIVKDLEAAGNLVKEEAYTNQVGHSERTDAVIEPRLSMQWWMKMSELAKPALAAVLEDEIAFFPPKYKNLYRHWMEGIKDWCISRQLWWGQRIPVWYDHDGKMYVAETEEEAMEQFRISNSASPIASDGIQLGLQDSEFGILRQDQDCLDTWFSSWLWAMEVFGWNAAPDNKDLAYYYPTTTLVTAPEIIFFWVARMVMAGYHFKNEKPFKQVYFTGIVRDKQGRKMSKQLGNSPDLLQLIEDNGTDAVRFSVMISSPAGNDLLFDESQIDQGKFFINKMWNALKLVKMWESRVDADGVGPIQESARNAEQFAIEWMAARIAQVSGDLEILFKDFRLSEALKIIYSLIWDDFCSWYLEWVKPAPDAALSERAYQKTIQFFEHLVQLLHPFLPFITEEIYQQLQPRSEGDFLLTRPQATFTQPPAGKLEKGLLLQSLITAIRDARLKAGLKPKDPIRLFVTTADESFYTESGDILRRQVNAEGIAATKESREGAMSIVVNTEKIYIESDVAVDTSGQRDSLEKEQVYLSGFLASVEKKLSNERFIANAKEDVINLERKKQSDTLARLKAIEESLSAL